ncbi:hypothetical protein BVY04_02855 [bacterium M21]|nr:hypothetical protein BVY04_02855 [bacterium M21]
MSGDANNRIGQRRSARRDAIVDVLQEADGALTPDEILEAAEKHVPGIGIATIYRNLKLLQEAEVIKVLVLPDGQSRYELSGKHHHHHFHCRLCGRAFCLDGCPLKQMAGIELPPGFMAEGHEITFHGTCPDCG